jgi:cytochrome c556
MYKKLFFAGLFLLLPYSATPAPKFEEDFMQAVEDTHKSLASNLAVQNAESSKADAELLQGYFAEIEDGFVKAGDAPEGVELAKKSGTLIAEVLKTLNAGDFDAAAKSSNEIGRTCKECHRLYRQD